MTLRRTFLLTCSIVLAVLLLVLLVKVSKIDIRATVHQLEGVRLLSVLKLLFLNVLLVYFSSEKWRSIDFVWRQTSELIPSRTTSFALTSAGLALGMLLPVQLAMSTARTLGTFYYGRALKRGTAGTLFEQSFDLLVVTFLGIASGTTYLFKGGAIMWTTIATIMIAVALLAAGLVVRVFRWILDYCANRFASVQNRLLKSLTNLQHSGILNAKLARRLVNLSTARFCIVVLMSIQTAAAMGLHISHWQMAAAIPFVGITSIIAVTPGGVGVNEIAGVTSLRAFGAPLAVAAQWALGNRVLIAFSYFILAACAAIVLGTVKVVLVTRSAMQNR